ncbi:glycine betaine ABC transporter substrate-binding protein OsmF [Spirochaeta africana]|uniref:Periplasmic glycine betaine/choline-binding (Lipo)protein of an ABC-type transport system (Osmoprotectant binding protein) n=1 Tax=Spirochaeta africana (strain ATCC 700263 / DSM 8902 / Z-7692) TaxID=889378 RepID=H9UI39_SPIAZ|nr:ABC transporter substrate-binding protein [Spirochaeta africana]AFG37182.1 periplasmic glycine betaine/choline-binding (lipo)protein of an ABC-type transport system (osmoprotectant binding protein) [Spirochaeta africana DSM 8902]
MNRKLCKAALTAVLAAVVMAGCAGEETADRVNEEPIVVASKIDTEGALLGSMIRLVLEEHNYRVNDRTEFGPTDVIRRAIINDEIDIYPEYTGNGGFFFADTPSDVWKDFEAGYELVKRLDLEVNNIIWLQPAPANNTWAIAVREDLAQQQGLRTMQDLGEFVAGDGNIKLAGSEEFVNREDALPAFEQAYGFSLSGDQLLVLSGGNTAMTAQAAARQTDGVNAAMAYGTDGQLAALGLRVMQDNLGVQPVYAPAPLVRAEILQQYPGIEQLLTPVFAGLELETLQRLNAAIAVDGRAAATVAREYLTDAGFIQ